MERNKLVELACESPEYPYGIAHISPHQTFVAVDPVRRATVYLKDVAGGAVDLETGNYYNPPVFSQDRWVRVKIKQIGFVRC